MFDKAIIDTDRFMDLPMSSKALYFLLGMDADDEGFVSYKKITKIHGGAEDDIKILVAKEFVIMFESGIVVITDWHTNNWLDSRRIKATQHQKEKSQLRLIKVNNDMFTNDKKYVLSDCLADAKLEQNRIEQNRTEENIIHDDIEIVPVYEDEPKPKKRKVVNVELPDWLDKKVWDQWAAFRKDIRKTLTPRSIELQLRLLTKFRDRHVEILENSIQNGWTGLFEPKAIKILQNANKTQDEQKYDKYN